MVLIEFSCHLKKDLSSRQSCTSHPLFLTPVVRFQALWVYPLCNFSCQCGTSLGRSDLRLPRPAEHIARQQKFLQAYARRGLQEWVHSHGFACDNSRALYSFPLINSI